MRCETSFFSLTLFKKHLQRYWPIWAVWLAGWTLAIPVELWKRASGWDGHSGAVAYAGSLDRLLSVTTDLLALAAPLVAVCVFFHLFKGPAANFVGALPLRREGVFATAFTAGYWMLTAPLMIVSLIALVVEGALGIFTPGPLLAWLGGSLLLAFFWFSFATLCCVISGNAVAAASFYVIFNGVVAVMVWLVQSVLQAFLYGFSQFSDGVWRAVMWLTPFVQTTLDDWNLAASVGDVTRFEMLWVYAAVGFLMLLAALGLHHVRKSERAGDLIAFGPIRWMFRISVTLCGGLAFGMLLMSLIFWDADTGAAGLRLACCCAVAAVVSWFAAEMLLQKSFKVFKSHWKGAAVGALCFVVAICAIDMDWIGFTTRVPKAGQVKSATATFGGDVDPVAGEGLVYDGETVAQLIALQQYMVDHQKDEGANLNDNYHYYHISLEYDLGLTTLRRDYTVHCGKGSPLIGLADAAQAAGLPDLDLSAGDPAGGYVEIRGEEDQDGWYYDLGPVEAQRVWQALAEDWQAGRYRADGGTDDYASYVELYWSQPDGGRDHQMVYPRPAGASLNAVLEELRPLAQPEGEEEQKAQPTAETTLGGGEEIVP